MIAFWKSKISEDMEGGRSLLIGSGLRLKRGLVMNQNINYIGMVNLLRRLQSTGLVSRKEAKRIAVRLRAETGADVISSP